MTGEGVWWNHKRVWWDVGRGDVGVERTAPGFLPTGTVQDKREWPEGQMGPSRVWRPEKG
ncbi:hypothetical protein E2C01_046660 [Portunus trituberculatus]|uniref:Uncharacterized protein n=1 Tax=Portunus trituberculatus TaxID=210409 RepID=A0A5B7G1K1_PORTR|nr:hypothetical protein [Portunus trituberculatus]